MDGGIIISLAIVFYVLLLIVGLVIYFLPSIIAYKGNHANKGIILLLNFLLGWTFLGWAGTLVWSLVDREGQGTQKAFRNVGGNKYEDLARLQKLKDSGTITEVEFEIEKQKLLR